MRICGRLCGTGEVTTIVVSGSRIAGVLPGCQEPDHGGPNLWLAPGFLDLQINGYAGHDFSAAAAAPLPDPAAEFRPILQAAARAGTALLCPTVITNSREALLACFRSLARAAKEDPWFARAVPGFHLEGPYLAEEDGPRGAHPRAHVRDPDWEEFQRLQEAAGGRIRLCTLAPERPGALAFIERLVEGGVVAAIGHTGASAEQLRDAVSAGARLSTHLGNGAHAVLPRHPNYLWQQMADDDLLASVIADGDHLPPATLKTIARAKGPERLVLVSDAISLGGLAPGVYQEGRYEVRARGAVRLAGTPYLAGAGDLLDVGVAKALRYAGLSLPQAIRCVTANAARLLGLDGRKGHLRVGCDADLTLFRVPDEGPLQVAATFCAGEVVHASQA